MGVPRFLILEDDQLFSRHLARFVARRGLGEAVIAETGQEAEVLLAEGLPWAGLIMDNRIPGRSGLEILGPHPSTA